MAGDRPAGTEQDRVQWVVFNADDFGASDRVNRAIVRAHAEGVLTSASLMVNEAAAGDAVRLANEHPKLAVGLHVVLSNGRAALSARDIPHLVESAGRFREAPARAGFAMFFSRAARREVEREVEAQFERFASFGQSPSHVDGHQHLHLHPVVWDTVIRQCVARGVRSIRIPNEELILRSPGRTIGRRLEWVAFRVLRRRCLQKLVGIDIAVADRVYGHLETGRVTETYLCDLLSRLGGRTNEVYCHPGADSAIGKPDLDRELDALISPAVRASIDSNQIRLATYPQLPHFPGSERRGQ